MVTNKVKATILGAIFAFLATTFGLDLDAQSETLINAAVPVIAGYLWKEEWGNFAPKRKVWGALISAIVVYVAFRLGIDLPKPVENFINALIPVIVALLIPERDSASPSSASTSRVQ
jgi:hypothetical protein